MLFSRHVTLLAMLTVIAGCSGGDSATVTAVGAAWPKFRHDSSNTGQGVGAVFFNNGEVRGTVSLFGQTSASPAINSDGSLYLGTESCTAQGCEAVSLPTCPCLPSNGGALFAIDPDSIQARWATQENSTCAGDRKLGAMTSSPAVYTFDVEANIYVGSESGRVHAFKDTTDATQPTAVFCFDPMLLPASERVSKARFTSSPTYTLNSVSLTVDGVFIGAAVEATPGQEEGRIYSIANDGTLRWQFPRTGAPRIAPVSSSPAIVSGTLYFIANSNDGDGQLYALDLSGNLKWSRAVGKVLDTNALFAVSPVSVASGIFVGTADGTILAINPDGSERWRRSNVENRFHGSLALGVPLSTPTPTETPTPLESPTPQPTPTGEATGTPTPTLTPLPFQLASTLVGVTIDGRLVMFAAAAPTPIQLEEAQEVEGQVLGSPAISFDGQVVFAASTGSGGLVYVLDMLTGLPPATPTGTPSPVPWPKAIEGTGVLSSPVIGNDGSIWIGTKDGKLYAIGTNL